MDLPLLVQWHPEYLKPLILSKKIQEHAPAGHLERFGLIVDGIGLSVGALLEFVHHHEIIFGACAVAPDTGSHLPILQGLAGWGKFGPVPVPVWRIEATGFIHYGDVVEPFMLPLVVFHDLDGTILKRRAG